MLNIELVDSTIIPKLGNYCVSDSESVYHQANPDSKQWLPNDIREIIQYHHIDTYHIYVKPIIKASLNDIFIVLTGIGQDMVNNSQTFDILWKDIHRFLAKHSLISFQANRWNIHSFTWITCGNWNLRTTL